MEKKKIEVNRRLNITFGYFRQKEGIKEGQLSSLIEPIGVYSVLMNRRFKKENNLQISDLEEQIAFESGKFIRAYVAEKFTQSGFNELPYPLYDITLDECLGILTEGLQTSPTRVKGSCIKAGANS